MNKIVSGLTMALLLMSSSSANAQEYANEGYYAGLAYVYASAQGDYDEDGNGASFWAGNHGLFVPWLATEFQVDYLDYGSAKSGSGDTSFDIDTIQLVMTGNLRAYPLQYFENQFLEGRLQPFALVGAGVGFALVDASGDDDDADFDDESGGILRFGGGVNAFVTEAFSLNATVAYNLGLGGIDEIETLNITAGAQFHFF